MRDMIAKLQDRYKNNAMHVNPKHKWCMKKNLVKPKIFIAISIGRETASIDRKSGKVKFWKIEQVNAETP